MSQEMGRRKFLGLTGLGLGAASLSAVTRHNDIVARLANSQATGAGLSTARRAGEDWREMDRLHKEAVDKFLANIGAEPNFWRAPLTPTIVDGVKVFDITCENIEWETAPGEVYPAFAYNGMVPGPEIRVTEGDRVRINFTNNMTESTGVHFHGLVGVPNSVDGIPFVTQPAIEPGQTFSYEFDAVKAGTFMYHSHHNAAEQVVRGLLGSLIIEAADKSKEPQVAADYVMVLNDSGLGYTLNGKSFPYTQPILAKKGDRIRVRYMNEGLMIHPMHLHGLSQLVFAKDGWTLPQPFMCDTLNVAPGERYDVLIDCEIEGLWAYHCHVLTHAESRNGMFGMVTVLVVEA